MTSLWLTGRSTLNVAHQGANVAAPSNTLAAFRRAAELGASGVELDAQLSADGVPVIIHDFTVDRTTDGTGKVSALTLAALKELDAGSWFDPAFAGERIPTLAEVFESIEQRLLINVELKVHSNEEQGLEKAVVDLVQQHQMTERVLISSFNPLALQRTRRLAPHLPLGFLFDPLPSSWLARLRVRLMPELDLEAMHPHTTLVRRATVRRAHSRGRHLVVWTVDERARMEQLVDWGVDAIITNHPDRLEDVLEAR